ncbi:unnamed protein product [Haemonchus placei]|uniref:Replication stress response regulator SDE2 n=1 Tax=Haemonchus placei TaxID=6290 RepID=A0A0N4WER6_HAEPC|nr:unnamed protein product [Haemonchus placei]
MIGLFSSIAKDLLKRGDACSDSPFYAEETIWFEVLKRCDGRTLNNVDQACQLFHRILKQPQFWIEKCEYDNVGIPPLSWRKFFRQKELNEPNEQGESSVAHSFDYKKIFYRRPYNRNLAIELDNTSTIKKLEKKGMHFQSQGDGIIVEHPPMFCTDEVPVCFATSYEWCHRFFEIDLEKAGVEGWVMDVIRPIITVRERCACREDCGAVYELKLQLLKRDENYDKNVILPRFPTQSRFWGQWEGTFLCSYFLSVFSFIENSSGGKSWETVEHVFSDYPCGMRKLAVMSRGKDSQFWAGHYGAKFGATEVIVTFPDNPRKLSAEDFPDEEKKLLDYDYYVADRIDKALILLYSGKKNCRNTSRIEDLPADGFFQLHFRILGGKGGFGSLLRSFRVNKSTNQLMCRDLNGRRLASIDEEQRLKRWIERTAEREREKIAKKKAKYEKLKSGPPKHMFHDPEYMRQKETIIEKTEEAFEAGLIAFGRVNKY